MSLWNLLTLLIGPAIASAGLATLSLMNPSATGNGLGVGLTLFVAVTTTWVARRVGARTRDVPRTHGQLRMQYLWLTMAMFVVPTCTAVAVGLLVAGFPG